MWLYLNNSFWRVVKVNQCKIHVHMLTVKMWPESLLMKIKLGNMLFLATFSAYISYFMKNYRLIVHASDICSTFWRRDKFSCHLTGRDVMEKGKISLTLPAIKPKVTGCPAHALVNYLTSHLSEWNVVTTGLLLRPLCKKV